MNTRNRFVSTAAMIGAIAGSCAAAPMFELVIKNTDPVPALAGVAWATSSPFQASTIDASGNVGFRGTLLTGTGGVTSSNNATMWYGAPGSLSSVARTGDQAPGLPSGVLSTNFQSQNLPMSPNGQLWFGGGTSAPTGYIATGPIGGLTKVARNGDILPGVTSPVSGSPASSSNYSNVNNLGQTMVAAGLVDGSVGLWVGSGAGLNLAYQSGQTYAGLPSSTTIKTPQSGQMINGSGNLLAGILMNQNAGAGITDANNEFLTTLAFGGSSFSTIAREADAAPGSGGATYQRGLFNSLLGGDDSSFFFTNGNYNNAGHVLFGAGLEGAGVVGTTNNAGMFAFDGTSTSLFRRKGDATTAVPGATLAISANTSTQARLNNNDDLAWTASLTQGVGGVTSSNDAVLLRSSLAITGDTLIAREGSNVPVVPGALWGTSFTSLMQNNAGQMVFLSTLLDDAADPNNNVTASNDLSLFAWDPSAGLMLLAREGDSLASIGVNMTLTGGWAGIYATANAEGGANAFSDTGWLTLRVSGTALAGSTDTSAIVRMRVIPGPGSLSCLVVGGAAMLRRRRSN